MGGNVKGQKMFGTYPDLFADNPLDTGRGRLIPTTSCDEYFAELADWFGVSRSDLPAVFPNIERFYDIRSTQKPIGFKMLMTHLGQVLFLLCLIPKIFQNMLKKMCNSPPCNQPAESTVHQRP